MCQQLGHKAETQNVCFEEGRHLESGY
jgi:hypothetical protein